MINVHPSLLPKYRGAAPIHRQFMNGEVESGVSIITVDEHKFDAGKILLQRKMRIDDSDDFTKLSRKLGQLGSDLLDYCLFESNYDELYRNASEQEGSMFYKVF
jgi:methionyl-tRNA formyltransferase